MDELDLLEEKLEVEERAQTRRRLEKDAAATWGSVHGVVAASKVVSLVGVSASEVGELAANYF